MLIFLALSHPFTAKEIAEKILHGFPISIVSDQEQIFISQFWEEMFKMPIITLIYSSSYHSDSNGKTKVVKAPGNSR